MREPRLPFRRSLLHAGLGDLDAHGPDAWKQRKTIAEGPLRAALNVNDAASVAGKRILIVDDVFTEGFTIREVARSLILAGAVEVSEVVLAREPWKGE